MIAWAAAVGLFLAVGARAETLRLDASTGSFHVLLYKDGPLQALGHDHVVAAPAFQGEVELSSSSAALTLTLEASSLQIDEPEARASEKLPKIKDGDRTKIAASMRGAKGLDVARYPEIALRSDSIEPVAGEADLWMVTARFSLHGSSATIDFPVKMTEASGGRWFSGYVRLRPSDYGVKPFSVFGGAVRLRDEALVKFDLFGRRAP